MYNSLETRMKEYERTSNLHLTRRMPCVIRLDGVAFHTFTKGLKKPFDEVFLTAMQHTMLRLCEDIQGVVFGYTQSDEITLVLQDYKNLNTAAWFDKSVQKMVSVAAAKATMNFNKWFLSIATDWIYEHKDCDCSDYKEYIKTLDYKFGIATFDARVFCLPESEVANCLVWRQQDAMRNSVQAVVQANYTEKQLQGLSVDKLKDKLLAEKNIDWNGLPLYQQRGACCYRVIDEDVGMPFRPKWIIDMNTPIFSENREFVEKHLPKLV